jgi:glutamate dehydrogenase
MNGDSMDPAMSDSVIEAVAKALKRKTLTNPQESFARQIAADWRAEELPGVSLDALSLNLAEFWRFAEAQTAGAEPQIRLAPAKGLGGRALKLDLLEIVQEDRPFLVDSVMGELADAGLDVRAMFHPVVTLGGRETSMILVVLAPVGEDRRAALMEGLKATLEDVRLAVTDFAAMTALMKTSARELAASSAPDQVYGRNEYIAFLDWLTADRFVFLGARTYEYPRNAAGDYAAEEPVFRHEDGLGILRDPSRSVLRRASEPAVLTPQLKLYLERAAPLAVAKSNLRSRVHRRANMDYVGIKRYGPDGMAIGEVRFVGLFTQDAYEARAEETPLVRRKIEHVIGRLGENPSTHTAKRLHNIVETYPRDELFQIDEGELYDTAMGVLHLYDRPRVRLFARQDNFDRFVSVLFYVPRERYDSDVRERAGQMIAAAWGGRISAYYPNFSAEPLARVHFVVGVTPGAHRQPDIRWLESEIANEVRTWGDRFESLIRDGGAPDGKVGEVLARYAGAFPAGYRDRYDATEALTDLGVIETMAEGAPLRIRAYRREGDSKLCFRFKLYHARDAVPLADVLPILENMGLKALTEDGFPIRRRDAQTKKATVWVHEFELEDARGENLVFADIKEPFERAFIAVWEGLAENDGFNRLVMELGASWREASLMRAFARYRQQTGLDPSQSVQTVALSAYPGVARLILDLFRIKFDPGVHGDVTARTEQADGVFAEIMAALQAVESLDTDRVLRRLALLVQAMVRTNYYQTGPDGEPKPYIAFKIKSRDLIDLPAPKPYREIFICSPRVEGVHLRFGPVARGGLRWSDRRDDFRTEVLGLVKAQQVKNAVIVPVGAKGGFYPKQLVRGASADETRGEAILAYKTFLCGLLDITDNLDAKGKIIRPEAVIAHVDDDPYLVVAADKGTATFSDIANGVAGDYGFWLGDAFASGGSAGYDHKVMGITARGAWEAVKRHFREMGKDIQTEPFTCIGVGDMSGDVFGNGALLSKAMKLVAAFDHRHIFIDPTPDPARSWIERQRMFDLPRSSWDDYDKSLISKGGGVFPRTAKTIALTPEIRALLEITDAELAPTDLIKAILKAKAELLYLGGIGTYIKAASESHTDVGDKANDAVRVDAGELRVQVVGEGANLGATQAGRIAFARAGGRIDTDAIDNSAGVDTSDHEVNIKILTGQAERAGALKAADRNPLLFSMTDEVAAHVLAHNYAQTLCLSLQEASAVADLDAQGRFMLELEAAGRLDRKVEGLPRAAAVADLRAAGKGLTRPELAVITAYGKLELSAEIVASAAPDDPYFEKTLVQYFPTELAKFEKEMKRHRLRREIISTVLANAMVDMVGPTFASRLKAATGCTAEALTVAFEAARQVFRLDENWKAVDALDLKAPAAAQLMLYQEIAQVLRGQTFWLTRHAMADKGTKAEKSGVQKLIDAYRPAADALMAEGATLLSPFEQGVVETRAKSFIEAGAPRELALAVAALRPLTATTDIADLAKAARWEVIPAARLYHAVGSAFGFDRLRAAAASISGRDPYERQAVRELILDMVGEQTARVRAIMALAKRPAPDVATAIDGWVEPRKPAVERARAVIDEIEQSAGGWSFAKLTIANAALKAASAQAGV